MIYVVIDTNVIVSALKTNNPDAPTLGVLRAAFEGNITLLYNAEIFDEYDEVLHREKFGFAEDRIQIILTYIREYGILTSKTPSELDFPDEDDRVFYEVSLSQEDSYVVTGNLKHYPIQPRIVTPAQMMELLA